MIWQDYVFATGATFFCAATLNTILSNQKPPRLSCGITAFWLWAFVGVYFSFGLWLSLITGIMSATGWTILLFQRRVK